MTTTVFFVRLGRWGIAGFSAIAFISTFVQTTAFYSLAGHTKASQAAFGSAMASLAAQFSAVFAPPLHPETVGGYVWWRGYQAVAILFAVWALASATAMVRTDENRGVIESALANGVARWTLIAARVVAFAFGVALASGAAMFGFIAALNFGGGTAEPRGVLAAFVAMVLLALSCYAISLLVSQLTAGRIATGAAGALLLTLFLINSLSRTFDSLSAARWLSPFRYFELNQPIAPGGAFNFWSVVVLAAITVVGTAASAAAFMRRDLGSALFAPPMRPHHISREPSTNAVWRWPIFRELYDRRVGLVAWSTGVLVLAVVFVWLTKVVVQPLLNISSLFPYFSRIVRGNVYSSVLGFTWFNFAELLIAAFAIVQVARWSAEDADGRLEIILSQPRSRAGVVVERMAAMLAGAAVIAAIAAIALFYASRAQGIELDAGRVVTASGMLIPLATAFATAGALLAAWQPRAAVGLLGAVAFLGYLDVDVGPLLDWPSWVLDLSPFKLFGTPLVTGLDGRNLAILIAISLACLGSSILAMQRRDIGA